LKRSVRSTCASTSSRRARTCMHSRYSKVQQVVSWNAFNVLFKQPPDVRLLHSALSVWYKDSPQGCRLHTEKTPRTSPFTSLHHRSNDVSPHRVRLIAYLCITDSWWQPEASTEPQCLLYSGVAAVDVLQG
jgi:hypothetical protein